MVVLGSVVTILKSFLDTFTLVARAHAREEKAVLKQSSPNKPHNTFWLSIALRPLKKGRPERKESISLVIIKNKKKSKPWGLGETGVWEGDRR